MDILQDIIMCEEDKGLFIKSPPSLQEQAHMFPLAPHLNAISSFSGIPLCFISDASYRTPPSYNHLPSFTVPLAGQFLK